MKRTYGTPLLRLVRGGTTLSEGEFALLRSMVEELPDQLRSVVESQFDEYNLVQREQDRRALNFYAMSLFSKRPRPVTQSIKSKRQEVPLIRVSALVDGDPDPLYAALTAVNGRAFCVSFSRPVPEVQSEHELTVTHVSQAWKSSFPQ
ncbi:hypothetical protein ACPOLB_05710 [Rubrivivax sp. RP6-9]|uniref:hypothetical protein n=1 Tax=Rubrivivax sp. RP6-9 TaxID=3415750 RepID=UPI003CC6AAFE